MSCLATKVSGSRGGFACTMEVSSHTITFARLSKPKTRTNCRGEALSFVGHDPHTI